MNKAELINSNLILAEKLAKKKKRRVDPRIHYDELKSAAYAGLVDAAGKYNHGSVPFDKYAGRRIIGEMEDYIRDLNWSRYHHVKMAPLNDSQLVDDSDNTLHSDAKKLSDAAFTVLPEYGRELFHMYYNQGKTMKQIGDTVGLTESMISKQIKGYHSLLRQKQDEIISIAERIDI